MNVLDTFTEKPQDRGFIIATLDYLHSVLNSLQPDWGYLRPLLLLLPKSTIISWLPKTLDMFQLST